MIMVMLIMFLVLYCDGLLRSISVPLSLQQIAKGFVFATLKHTRFLQLISVVVVAAADNNNVDDGIGVDTVIYCCV